MRYPEFLKKGSSVGFPAPSFGANIEPYRTRLKKALELIGSKGYRTVPGENAFKGEGVGISNKPENCAAELEGMYLDESIDTLISCGGGELMCEILEYIDFEKIRSAKPKLYMGYSDNTNFTFLLNTICDTAAVYGPCAGDFCGLDSVEHIDDAFSLFTGEKFEFNAYPKWERESLVTEEKPLEPFNPMEKRVHGLYYNGELIRDASESGVSFDFTGRITGGCMDCLVTLLGTRFDKVREFCERYKNDGVIWLIEACDLNVFGIRRAMWQMENAGWFDTVKGFVFGRALNGGSMLNLDCFDAFLEMAKRHNVPVILDADFGHIDPMLPVLMGSVATFKVNGNEMKVKYELK
ncbi:MAG: LD-carboxypeptidase [Lachnospiraceae bacterium]|nr:LD-carboxypeptidase [Lachnospiraceae bacterium]